MSSVPLRVAKPPPLAEDVSFAVAKAGVAVGSDAIPATLCDKMYKAWDFERAAKFEPELEQMLSEKLEANDQVGFDKIVRHLCAEFDADLAKRAAADRAEGRYRFVDCVADVMAKMISAIISAFWPPMH